MKWFLISGVALMASGSFVGSVRSIQSVQPDPAELAEEVENHSAASLVGEFRSSLSGYLWMKADEYLHGGVSLRALTEGERVRKDARLATVAGDPHEHAALDHHEETSVIPYEAQDPRWLWGALERHVKPYYDPKNHKHVNQVETAPLYRFMTWADPKFISAYSVGAYILFVADRNQMQRPIAFLREGVANAPASYILQADLGGYLARSGDLRAASDLLQKSIDRVKSNPPRSEQETNGLNDCYRWLIMVYRAAGKTDAELAVARLCLQRFPEDPIAQHSLQSLHKPGHILIR